MISIGAVIGGPECAFFDPLIRRFMKYCRENAKAGAPSVTVNIVYHLPGSINKPDYLGLRIGRFSTQGHCLVVQVAVEGELISSDDEATVLQYIYDTADEALGLAKSDLERRGVQYDLEGDRKVLDSWKQTVME